MIDISKDLRKRKFDRVWFMECPWCFGDIEFFNISPMNCKSCGRALPDFSDLMKYRDSRIAHYKASVPEGVPDAN